MRDYLEDEETMSIEDAREMTLAAVREEYVSSRAPSCHPERSRGISPCANA